MMKNIYFLAIIICLLLFSLSFFSVEGLNWDNLKYSGSAITADEISHIPSGYYYLKTGRYFINPEHPPLVKDIAGLPLLLLDPIFPDISDDTAVFTQYLANKRNLVDFTFPRPLEIENSQWNWGYVFLFNPENDPDQIAFWARLSVIAFNTILLFILFLLLSKIWNRRAALIGIMLLSFSPFNIANGSLVTMDFMSAILQIMALCCFVLYIKPFAEGIHKWNYFFLLILFLSLALLAKFSSVILLPTLFLGGFIFVFFTTGSWKSVLAYAIRYSSLMLSTFLFIAVFYYFHTWNMDNDEMIRQIVQNYPSMLPWWGIEVLVGLIINNPLTKGLAEYISGVLMVMGRMDLAAQETYFMGNVYGGEGAGWRYFPILYLTKTPIAMLVLLSVSLILFIRWIIVRSQSAEQKFRTGVKEFYILLLILYIYFYVVTTMSSNLQIGLRHIMPVIFTLTVLIARAIDVYWEKGWLNILKIKHLFLVASFGLVFTAWVSFPYYLSYYNYFGGGTEKGYDIATDANYDWGQDVKLLAKWIKDNNIHQIHTDVTTKVPLNYYLDDQCKALNYDIEWWGLPEPGSYIAVSAYEYQNNLYNSKIKPERKYSLLDGHMVARIGTTIFVFQVPYNRAP